MAVDIDDKFEDVDFTDPSVWPEDCKINGEPVCGDLGGTFEVPCGNYAADEPVLSWNEIDAAIEALDAEPESSLEFLIRRVYNQKNEGSCVGNASTQGEEVVGVKEFGKELMPELSAISMYKQIGRSPSSGAMVSDAMVALRETGVLPLDTPANRAKYGAHVMPPTGFHTKWPADWKTTAAKFRGAEFLTIDGLQEIFSAVCKGHPVIVGRQGHSILYLRPLPGRKFLYVNSWGQWGQAAGHMPSGFGVDSANQVKQSASWAFAIRAGSITL